MDVTLYTTHCPKCKVLEKKLEEKNIAYEEICDVVSMLQLGFSVVPILEVKGRRMDFGESVQWLNQQEKQEESN